jgi:hypothetical protein
MAQRRSIIRFVILGSVCAALLDIALDINATELHDWVVSEICVDI